MSCHEFQFSLIPCPLSSSNLLEPHHWKASKVCKYYKWKNHFYEMKEDVGMSLQEKGRNKKMPTPRHKVTHNPIPTSLFCFNMLFVCFVCYECIRQSKQHNILTSNCLRNVLCCGIYWKKQRCRDGVMSDFVSWCRHLFVPSFFMK